MEHSSDVALTITLEVCHISSLSAHITAVVSGWGCCVGIFSKVLQDDTLANEISIHKPVIWKKYKFLTSSYISRML